MQIHYSSCLATSMHTAYFHLTALCITRFVVAIVQEIAMKIARTIIMDVLNVHRTE